MEQNGHADLPSLVRALQGLPCWYVSCGGCTMPSFQLALGNKVPRQTPLKNPAQSEEFRCFEGEVNLLVWCSWRLDGIDAPLTSSDDVEVSVVSRLSQLIGASVTNAATVAPAWDLNLDFSNGLRLCVFCDHVPGEPSFDGNWELWQRNLTAFVGPGARCAIERRDEPVAPTHR